MKAFNAALAMLLTEDSGQDLVEYALLGALMALTSIASIKSAATGVRTVFGAVGTTITGAV